MVENRIPGWRSVIEAVDAKKTLTLGFSDGVG